ncbi:transport protein [Salmonella enterica subsp. arizonae]|nr:transport protein [Salmonella enterica subsp. arizonae]
MEPIDNVFGDGMMRMKFELPHGFLFMSTYTRPVKLLLCGLLLLTLAIAVLNTLVPLWLAQASLPTWQVGMVSSSYFTGNLVGTLFTGYLIKRIGFNRSYYLASLNFRRRLCWIGSNGGILELDELAFYCRHRLRNDLGCCRKRADVQRNLA